MDSEELSDYIDGYKQQYAPNQDVAIRVHTRNLSRVTLDIYRLNDNCFWEEGYRFGLFNLKRISSKVFTRTYDLPNEYNILSEKFDTIPCREVGNYVFHFHSGKHNSYSDICVSSVATGLRKVGNVQEIYAADIITGKPYKRSWRKLTAIPAEDRGSITRITPTRRPQ